MVDSEATVVEKKEILPEYVEAVNVKLNELEHRLHRALELIDQHADVINQRLQNEPAIDNAAEFMKRTTEFTDKIAESGQTYTTVVIGGAFAAAFTVWTQLKSVMTSQLAAFTAACLLLSLSIFVVAEIHNVVGRAFGTMLIQNIKKPTNSADAAEYLNKVGSRFRIVGPNATLYVVYLVGTIVPAIAASILMICEFLKHAL